MANDLIDQLKHTLKKGIEITLKNNCYGQSLILIYAAIDALANIQRPEKQDDVLPQDFINWVDKYIKFNSQEQISPEELYSARCALLHTFGVESKKTRSGQARLIGYVVGGYPPIRYNAVVNKDLVLLDILTLADSFNKGLDRFLIDFSGDIRGKQFIDARIKKMLAEYPL